jgi:hypothetical protein
MNIYKVEVTRKWDWGCDKFESFVCFAKNEKAARNMHPNGVGDDYDWNHGRSWVQKEGIETLKVTCIGLNVDQKTEEVIIASFNAG